MGGESDRRRVERLRAQEANREQRRGPEPSLCEAGGECVRMVPRFHPASVDCVPGCSLSLSAGRAAAFLNFMFLPFVIFQMSSTSVFSFVRGTFVCVLYNEVRIGWKRAVGCKYSVYTRCPGRCLAEMTAAAALACPPPPSNPPQPFPLPISLL